MPFIKHTPPKDSKICRSKEHNPPDHIHLSPGEHEWQCPDCGHIQVIIVNRPTYTCTKPLQQYFTPCQPPTRKVAEPTAKNYVVYFHQINQTGINVSALSKPEALKKAAKIWREDHGRPDVVDIEEEQEDS